MIVFVLKATIRYLNWINVNVNTMNNFIQECNPKCQACSLLPTNCIKCNDSLNRFLYNSDCPCKYGYFET
jgi:hypothetical protein